MFKQEATAAAAAASLPVLPAAPAAAAAASSSAPAVSAAAAVGPAEDEDMAPVAEPGLKRMRVIGGLEMGCFEGEPLADSGVLEISGLEAATDRSGDGLVPESRAYDARSGEELDLELVRLGRIKELERMKRHSVYREIAPNEAQGRKVKSRWVDEVRVKHGMTEVRSKLVAMEFNTFGR
jgi:hypothetical protein